MCRWNNTETNEKNKCRSAGAVAKKMMNKCLIEVDHWSCVIMIVFDCMNHVSFLFVCVFLVIGVAEVSLWWELRTEEKADSVDVLVLQDCTQLVIKAMVESKCLEPFFLYFFSIWHNLPACQQVTWVAYDCFLFLLRCFASFWKILQNIHAYIDGLFDVMVDWRMLRFCGGTNARAISKMWSIEYNQVQSTLPSYTFSYVQVHNYSQSWIQSTLYLLLSYVLPSTTYTQYTKTNDGTSSYMKSAFYQPKIAKNIIYMFETEREYQSKVKTSLSTEPSLSEMKTFNDNRKRCGTTSEW